jgi:hypothetical protein
VQPLAVAAVIRALPGVGASTAQWLQEGFPEGVAGRGQVRP